MKIKHKRLLAAVFSLAFIAGVPAYHTPPPFTVKAGYEYTDTYGIWRYAVEADEDERYVTLIGCSKNAEGEIVMPETIEGYPVRHFDQWIFLECDKITSLVISNNLSRRGIGISLQSAFADCRSLREIKVPENHPFLYSVDGVLFGKGDSNGSSFSTENVLYAYPYAKPDEEYTVPESTSVSSGAFCGCPNLKKIHLSDNTLIYGSVCPTEGSIYPSFWLDNLEEITVAPNHNVTYQGHDHHYYTVDGVLYREEMLVYGDTGELFNFFMYYPPGRKDTVWRVPGKLRYRSKMAVFAPQYKPVQSKYLEKVIFSKPECQDGYAAFDFMLNSVSGDCPNLKSIVAEDPEFVFDNFQDSEVQMYGYDNITVYGYENSTAQDFAARKGLEFKIIGSDMKTGDLNNDGIIDAADATAVLVEYAASSTGQPSTLTREQKNAADVNKDGFIDSADATCILTFYAFNSTGGNAEDISELFS